MLVIPDSLPAFNPPILFLTSSPNQSKICCLLLSSSPLLWLPKSSSSILGTPRVCPLFLFCLLSCPPHLLLQTLLLNTNDTLITQNLLSKNLLLPTDLSLILCIAYPSKFASSTEPQLQWPSLKSQEAPCSVLLSLLLLLGMLSLLIFIWQFCVNPSDPVWMSLTHGGPTQFNYVDSPCYSFSIMCSSLN